ncbi:MAG: S9 family peptidase [Chloroflexi bacterium]|nr:S9 family peptidase [Chloroflexota bacterium]OJW06319.1 MAG: peptidase S9 [Chloroflexi bacterium 54-19]
MSKVPIEVLLSARLFVYPKVHGEKLYFISNMGQGGHFSLYSMDLNGSLPQPLLPPQLALQNPSLMNGPSFVIFPSLGKILVMLDHDGDENYQPMFIPLDGGLPEPALGDRLQNFNVTVNHADTDNNLLYLATESRTAALCQVYRANLSTGEFSLLKEDRWTNFVTGVTEDNHRAILSEGYSTGDNVLYEWQEGETAPRLLYGVPLADRAPGQEVPLNSLGGAEYVSGDQGLLLSTSIFEDTYGLGYLDLAKPGEILSVKVSGTVHNGAGEFEGFTHLHDNRFTAQYNIDGVSWLYEGEFDEAARELRLDTVIVGEGELANGVLEAANYDKESDRFALSFSTATSPSQLYTVGKDRTKRVAHTHERILGVKPEWLSPGEDASFTSFDGLRISARLYLPAPVLGYTGKRPLVYYIHGGPQGQERPDFTWFSMPLIQFLTLNGFAVFVPNVRGSVGYGLSYTKRVDRDWGGQDRLDHVHAMKLLSQDDRVDTGRAGVIGRSYGGYMTLTLASRHPDFWKAAVDMFGPVNLSTFIERVPATWRPYFALTIGDPANEKDRPFLDERSPSTYADQIQAAMLVIQGQNDPRVTEIESRELVERLRSEGKSVDYLLFPDEGHDVLKFSNRATCYNRITAFFSAHL